MLFSHITDSACSRSAEMRRTLVHQALVIKQNMPSEDEALTLHWDLSLFLQAGFEFTNSSLHTKEAADPLAKGQQSLANLQASSQFSPSVIQQVAHKCAAALS